MKKDILVAYASKYGSTAEIAKKIGEVLTQKGLSVKVAEVKNVHDLSSYRAVILGSAVYIGRWRKDAVRFMKAFETDLREKKVWIFSTGPTGNGDPVELLVGWDFPTSLKPIAEKIKPEDIIVFHGAVDMEKLNRLHRYMVNKVKAPAGDFRVWADIIAWAEGIADKINRLTD